MRRAEWRSDDAFVRVARAKWPEELQNADRRMYPSIRNAALMRLRERHIGWLAAGGGEDGTRV